MKTVFFVRHAKSSWADLSLPDHKRPLNKRGLRDAPFMAAMLHGKGVKPDAIISSFANRALTTAQYFAKEMGFEKDEIIVKKKIYEAYAEDVLDVVKKSSDVWDTIMVFGHNPTFTSIANRFSDDYIANVPTCGIVRVDAKVDSWKDFSTKNAERTAFFYPKQYFD